MTDTFHADFIHLACKNGEAIHRWSSDEIMAEDPRSGWFYGIVQESPTDFVVCEINAGIGYSVMEEKDLTDEVFIEAMTDLWNRVPTTPPQKIGILAQSRRSELEAMLNEGKFQGERSLSCTHASLKNISIGGEPNTWCSRCYQLAGQDGKYSLLAPPDFLRSLGVEFEEEVDL